MPSSSEKLSHFYKSDKWQKFRQLRIAQNIDHNNGILVCDHCHKLIHAERDCEVHHIKHLTEENVGDGSISLSVENTQCVHHQCHNSIHKRYNGQTVEKQVFLVYGPPFAGKESYVQAHASPTDLVVSMDRIQGMISSQGIPSKALNRVAFQIRSTLFDCIRRRIGQWDTAWIIQTAPSRQKRVEMCREFKAEPIYIESTLESCLRRRQEQGMSSEYDTFIRSWFKDYKPD